MKFNIWYCDNGILVGDFPDFEKAISIVLKSSEVHIRLNEYGELTPIRCHSRWNIGSNHMLVQPHCQYYCVDIASVDESTNEVGKDTCFRIVFANKNHEAENISNNLFQTNKTWLQSCENFYGKNKSISIWFSETQRRRKNIATKMLSSELGKCKSYPVMKIVQI